MVTEIETETETEITTEKTERNGKRQKVTERNRSIDQQFKFRIYMHIISCFTNNSKNIKVNKTITR